MKKQSQTINFFILLAFLSFNFAFAQNSGLTYKSEQKSTANYRFRKTPGSEKNDIIYQRCEWTVDPSEKDLEGTITYYFKAKENNITEIVFNLYDNMIVDAVVQRGNPVPFTHADSLIRITLEPPLLSDDLDSLSIVYHGTPDPSDGYSYVQGTHNYAPIVRTHSEPYNAELWYPCKNNLKDKVDSTDIFITIPEGNMAASNGKLISVTPKDNNQVTFHWKHRYPIATYLVAFAVTNYVAYSDWYVRNEADSVEILNYVYPESMAGAQSMTAFTPGAMSAFEEIAGDYPFSDEKYGHAECIAIGGTEHQTMTFMGGFDVLTIVHELAHQWFGNMITCGSWSDIWLNEGFATYCEGLYYERLGNLTTWEAWKKSAITLTTQWENGSVYCYDTSYYESIFQPIVYYKGAMVLHMLRWVVGDEAFFQGMWNYAHDPALCHGIAFTSDFVKHIEEASGKDLTDFFDTWVYKEGYPNYTIKVIQTDSHHAQLDLIQKPTHSSVACFKMPIPIQFIGNGKDTTITFDNNALKQSFEFDPGFMVEKIVFDPEKWLVCQSTSTIVGINDIDNENFVEVYPNPFQNQITLKYRLPEKARWSLSDLSGKVLKTGKLTGTEGATTLSVPDLNAGIYILNIQTGNNLIIRKLISE